MSCELKHFAVALPGEKKPGEWNSTESVESKPGDKCSRSEMRWYAASNT